MNRIDMRVTAVTLDVLHTLKKNRETHAQIVQEAREGYVTAATKALRKRLSQLRKGEIATLQFGLHPPQDYTSSYDTAISMLGLHTGTTLELSAQDVQTLVLDNWDWSDSFLVCNSAYSGTAEAVYKTKPGSAQGSGWET